MYTLSRRGKRSARLDTTEAAALLAAAETLLDMATLEDCEDRQDHLLNLAKCLTDEADSHLPSEVKHAIPH